MNAASLRPPVPMTLHDCASLPKWVAWRNESRDGNSALVNKVPYSPTGGKASANNPETWGTREAAEACARRMSTPGGGGGVGIELGDLGNGNCLGGIDLDTCRRDGGTLEPWAGAVLDRLASYTEVSPSGNGVKTFFVYRAVDLPALKQAMNGKTDRKWARRGKSQHPPAIELYLAGRYFTVTDAHLDGTTRELRPVPFETLQWLIGEAGPQFAAAEQSATNHDTHHDKSRSATAFRKGSAFVRQGLDFDAMCCALAADLETAAWTAEKGAANDGRELQRIYKNAAAEVDADRAAFAPVLEAPDMGVLTFSRREPPQFPLHELGDAWAGWVAEAAEAAGAPTDYAVGPLLATASALIGHARWAEATPGWKEPPHLWCCVVGDSGSGKSPGADVILRDVLPHVEERMTGDFPIRHRAWRAAKLQHDAAADRQKAALRSGGKVGEAGLQPPDLPPRPAPPTCPPDLPNEPLHPRLVAQDATIEKVATLLAAAAPKGLLVARDELAGWLRGMTNYNDSGRAFWLECYGGRPYSVDRQKNPEPIRIPRLAVSVTGGTQPEKLAELFRDADDGLLARFLWFWPATRRFRLARAAPATDWAIAALDRLRCLETAVAPKPGDPQPPVFVRLVDNALPMLESFGQEMQDNLENASGLMRSTFGKARGTALRLALVLEFLWWCGGAAAEPPPTRISVEAFAAATRLVRDYFGPMAERCFGDAAIPKEDRDAGALARWIIKTGATEVHVRQLQREVRLPGLRDATAIKAAAEVLEHAGWLTAPTIGKGEARKVAYRVNPRVHAAPR